VDGTSETTLLGAAWRRKWVVVASVVVALVAGLLYGRLRSVEDQYVAEATILLQDPAATIEGGGTSDRFVVSQVELLRSPVVAEAAVEVLAAGDPVILVDSLSLLDQSAVSSSTGSSLVFLRVVDPEGDRAIAKVNAMAEGYRTVARSQATQSTTDATGRIDAQLEAIEGRLLEIDGEIALAVVSDPGIGALQSQAEEAVVLIAQLQDELATAGEDEASSIRLQINDLRNRLDVYRQVGTLAVVGSEFRQLITEQEQLIARRADLTQRRDQVQIDGDLAPDSVALLSSAQIALPVPQGSGQRTLAVSLVLGALAGLGLAYLLDVRRRVFAGRLEPERILGVPLLADIPDFGEEGLASRLPVRDAPRSAAAEAFRFAAASLDHAMRTSGATSVMVVASTLGHGKTTAIVNTGMASAGQGHSVIVVDCDFGNQDASALVAGDAQPPPFGFTDVVEAGIAFERAVESVNLGNGMTIDLLSRGSRPTVAANLVRAPGGRAVFESATASYDLVFVDAPPILQVAYASSLAGYVDGLVVVVAHGTPVRELEDLVSRLRLIGTPVLGYLYNRSPLRSEMTASEGSMMDILGTGRVRPEANVEVAQRPASPARRARSTPRP
jgi:Mrp family chromosome partitioning ATPase/capsular polysaccharide biosynthesis protein